MKPRAPYSGTMKTSDYDLMIQHGVKRVYMRPMQTVIDSCIRDGETPEQVLIRWRKSSCKHWFYPSGR